MSNFFISLPPRAGGDVQINGFAPAFTDTHSVVLDGAGAYIDGGNAASLDLSGQGPMWLGAWVYVENWQLPTVNLAKMEVMGKVMDAQNSGNPNMHKGYHMRVITNQPDGPYYGRACLYIVSSFYLGVNHYLGITSPDNSVPLRTWTRIDVASLDGTAAHAKMWINGAPVAFNVESDTLGVASIKTNAKFTFGSRNGVENFLWGKVNDPLIANFVPTQGDIDLIMSTAPTNAAALTFSQPILSAWYMGDQDVAPTITDHVGSVNLTLTNGAAIEATTQSTPAPTPTVGWTPSSTLSAGTLRTWLDATDNATITQAAGAVSQWRDKSSNAFTWSASSHKPTISTLNARQAIASNGTQWLAMDNTTRLMGTSDKFILAIACQINAFPGANLYPGLILDGDNSTQCTKIGFSNNLNAGGTYTDFFLGSNSGFSPVRWQVASAASPPAADDFSVPKKVVLTLEYDGQNGPNGFVGTFNSIVQYSLIASGFGAQVAPGRLFAIDDTDIHNGPIGEIVLIKNPDALDVLNLKTYMTSRWA